MNAFMFTIIQLLMLLLQDYRNYVVSAFPGSYPRSLFHVKTDVRTKVNPSAISPNKLPCATTFLSTLNQEAMSEASDVKETPCVSLPPQEESNSNQNSRSNLIKRAFVKWTMKKLFKKPLENLATSLNEARSISTTKGIRLSYLLNEFIDECGGREPLQGLTTKDVFEQFILPATTKESKFYLARDLSEESLPQELDRIDVFQQFLSKESKLSYCDLILANQTANASTDNAVLDANVLISSSPDHKFLDVLDILAHHFKDEPDTVIWLDLFSLNIAQYMTLEHPEPEWWLRTFSNEVVKKLNHTVMVMPQWNDPTFFVGIPQLYAGLHTYETTGAKFEIAMTDDEFRSFLNECKNDYSKVIRKMLNFYDLQNNEEVKELEAAHDVFIENTLASKYLQLSELIRDWIEDVGRSELEKVVHNSKDEMDLMSMLGSICMEKKQFDEAESFFRESSSMREKVLGAFHFDTLRSINDLASVYCRLGLYGKAEIIYEANLCRCQQCLESGNPLLLETMSNLGAVYENQNKTEMAEPLFQDCLSASEKYLEAGHPKTLESMLNLARLLNSRGNHKDAHILFQDCLAKCEKHLGSDHATTRSCKARLTLNEKCLKDSHVMTSDEIEIANLLEKVNENGLNCRGSLEAQISLVMHIQEQGLLTIAYCLCASCLLRSELLLVRHDPLAIIIVAVMASLLFSLGDYKNAELLLDDYVRRRHESPVVSLGNEGLSLLEETLLSELMKEKESTLGETSFVNFVKAKLHEPWYKHPFRMLRLWRFRAIARMLRSNIKFEQNAYGHWVCKDLRKLRTQLAEQKWKVFL